jgi:outer membrane protein assembly factor BamE (lipoprotein component of BamABCDE complex)
MKNLLSTCAIALSLMGCVSKTGNMEIENTSPRTLDAIITKHVTSAAEIRGYLGSPLRTEVNQHGQEVWTYVFKKTDVKARTFIPIANLFSSEVDTNEKTIVITFDANKKVSDYAVAETAKKNRAGILEQ